MFLDEEEHFDSSLDQTSYLRAFLFKFFKADSILCQSSSLSSRAADVFDDLQVEREDISCTPS